MSCNRIEILPYEPEIVQLQKELFQARYDASFYKSHYQNGIAIRERIRYEHDAEIRKLKQKHKRRLSSATRQLRRWKQRSNCESANYMEKKVNEALVTVSH